MGRSHWAMKVKEARHWHQAVLAATSAHKPEIPLFKAKLTLTRISSSCPDSDGLVSSFKHVVDGLRHAKIIKDDKFINIGMPEYRWEKGAKGNGHIEITVEAVEI